jgi:hypothetical protein
MCIYVSTDQYTMSKSWVNLCTHLLMDTVDYKTVFN